MATSTTGVPKVQPLQYQSSTSSNKDPYDLYNLDPLQYQQYYQNPNTSILGFSGQGQEPYQNWFSATQRANEGNRVTEANRQAGEKFNAGLLQSSKDSDYAQALKMLQQQQAGDRYGIDATAAAAAARLAQEGTQFTQNLGWQKESQQNALANAMEQIRLQEQMSEQLFGTKLSGVKGLYSDVWDRMSPMLSNLGFQTGTQPGEVTGFNTLDPGMVNLNAQELAPLQSSYQQSLRQINAPGRSRSRTRAQGLSQESLNRGITSALGTKRQQGLDAALGARGQNVNLLSSLMQMMKPDISMA
jgi:hypothetical protein